MISGTKTIYFDESGYTGDNLLDANQPVFTLASVDIQNCEARELLESTFQNYSGKEFKFSKIEARKRHRKDLLKFSEVVGKEKKRIYTCVCEKKFFALGGAVNTLAMPFFLHSGKDFFANEFNHKFNNLLYFGLKIFCGEELLDEFINEYCRFSRSPNNDSLLELQKSLQRIKVKCRASPLPDLAIYIGSMLLGALDYLKFHNFSFSSQRDRNDIQFLFALNLIRRWRNRTNCDIEVVHDNSKYFHSWRNLWKKFTSSEIPSGIIMDNEYPFIKFPLRVIGTRLEDSKNSFSLQLCDMIAGLATKYWAIKWNLAKQPRIDPIFYEEIFDAGLRYIPIDPICSFRDFVEKDVECRNLDESSIASQLLSKINDYRILRLLEIPTATSSSRPKF